MIVWIMLPYIRWKKCYVLAPRSFQRRTKQLTVYHNNEKTDNFLKYMVEEDDTSMSPCQKSNGE